MSLSLVIFEGATPGESIPLLATKDPTIIAFVRQLLWSRLQDRTVKAQTPEAGVPVVEEDVQRFLRRREAQDLAMESHA